MGGAGFVKFACLYYYIVEQMAIAAVVVFDVSGVKAEALAEMAPNAGGRASGDREGDHQMGL